MHRRQVLAVFNRDRCSEQCQPPYLIMDDVRFIYVALESWQRVAGGFECGCCVERRVGDVGSSLGRVVLRAVFSLHMYRPVRSASRGLVVALGEGPRMVTSQVVIGMEPRRAECCTDVADALHGAIGCSSPGAMQHVLFLAFCSLS